MLVTPLWSARRLPQAVVDEVGETRLAIRLDDAIKGVEACVVVGDEVETRAVRGVETPLTPASTEKLLTGYATLAILGAEFTYTTNAVAPAAPVNGAVERLWLVGAGDPTLATDDYRAWLATQPTKREDVTTSLETLADAIVASGVRTVPGGIVADDSRYDTTRYIPTWRDSYRSEGQSGPLGALVVNDGFAQFRGGPIGADDPARHAADQLAALLTARGVSVGATTRGTAPEGTVVGSVTSAPLSVLVASMVRSSDNHAAEMFTRENAVATGTRPGTTEAGVQATIAALEAAGLPTHGTEFVDGSGLDRGNRTTCGVLYAVDTAARGDTRFAALDEGLAVAGESGTLAPRFVGTDLQGRLRAKTGTLNGVTGLVGATDGARSMRFAFVANGSFGDAGAATMQRNVAEAVAAFPEAPAASELVPAPGS